MDGFQIFCLTLLLCVRGRLGRVTLTTSNGTNQQTHMNTSIVKFYSSVMTIILDVGKLTYKLW